MADLAGNLNIRAIDDLEDLANVILANAKTVKSFLSNNNIPPPSFSVDAPLSFPDSPRNVREARSQLLDASKKIQQLVMGPRDHLFWYSCLVCPCYSLTSLYHHLLTDLSYSTRLATRFAGFVVTMCPRLCLLKVISATLT